MYQRVEKLEATPVCRPPARRGASSTFFTTCNKKCVPARPVGWSAELRHPSVSRSREQGKSRKPLHSSPSELHPQVNGELEDDRRGFAGKKVGCGKVPPIFSRFPQRHAIAPSGGGRGQLLREAVAGGRRSSVLRPPAGATGGVGKSGRGRRGGGESGEV